ncbi:hypothetical protein [Bradyrhizobium sp. USDA 4473]
MAAFSRASQYERNKNETQAFKMPARALEPERRCAIGSFMKMAKAIRKQAQTAERVATTTADAIVAPTRCARSRAPSGARPTS